MQENRKIALGQIRANIDKFGHHVYMVQQTATPRFAYTIGLSAQIGTELILAGGNYFMAKEVLRIIDDVASALKGEPRPQRCNVDELGSFELQRVHDSWSRLLMLGALDYFQQDVVHALQIVPDEEHFTIDVPDCRKPWGATSEPIWQWIHSVWQFSAPPTSTAVTDLCALRGEPIIQAARWEEDQWELFSAPSDQFSSNEVRIVPLGTLLAFDRSLTCVTNLGLGQGFLRDSGSAEWKSW